MPSPSPPLITNDIDRVCDALRDRLEDAVLESMRTTPDPSCQHSIDELILPQLVSELLVRRKLMDQFIHAERVFASNFTLRFTDRKYTSDFLWKTFEVDLMRTNSMSWLHIESFISTRVEHQSATFSTAFKRRVQVYYLEQFLESIRLLFRFLRPCYGHDSYWMALGLHREAVQIAFRAGFFGEQYELRDQGQISALVYSAAATQPQEVSDQRSTQSTSQQGEPQQQDRYRWMSTPPLKPLAWFVPLSDEEGSNVDSVPPLSQQAQVSEPPRQSTLPIQPQESADREDRRPPQPRPLSPPLPSCAEHRPISTSNSARRARPSLDLLSQSRVDNTRGLRAQQELSRNARLDAWRDRSPWSHHPEEQVASESTRVTTADILGIFNNSSSTEAIPAHSDVLSSLALSRNTASDASMCLRRQVWEAEALGIPQTQSPPQPIARSHFAEFEEAGQVIGSADNADAASVPECEIDHLELMSVEERLDRLDIDSHDLEEDDSSVTTVELSLPEDEEIAVKFPVSGLESTGGPPATSPVENELPSTSDILQDARDWLDSSMAGSDVEPDGDQSQLTLMNYDYSEALDGSPDLTVVGNSVESNEHPILEGEQPTPEFSASSRRSSGTSVSEDIDGESDDHTNSLMMPERLIPQDYQSEEYGGSSNPINRTSLGLEGSLDQQQPHEDDIDGSRVSESVQSVVGSSDLECSRFDYEVTPDVPTADGSPFSAAASPPHGGDSGDNASSEAVPEDQEHMSLDESDLVDREQGLPVQVEEAEFELYTPKADDRNPCRDQGHSSAVSRALVFPDDHPSAEFSFGSRRHSEPSGGLPLAPESMSETGNFEDETAGNFEVESEAISPGPRLLHIASKLETALEIAERYRYRYEEAKALLDAGAQDDVLESKVSELLQQIQLLQEELESERTKVADQISSANVATAQYYYAQESLEETLGRSREEAERLGREISGHISMNSGLASQLEELRTERDDAFEHLARVRQEFKDHLESCPLEQHHSVVHQWTQYELAVDDVQAI